MPMLGARLARAHLRRPTCCSPTARRCSSAGPAARRQGRRRRGLDPVPRGLRRGRLRQAARDDGRQPDRPVRQPEHLLPSATARSPTRQLLGVRGAPGNTVNNPTSYWVPQALAPGLRRAGRHGQRRRLRPRGREPGRRDPVPRHPPGGHRPRRLRLRRARTTPMRLRLGAPGRDRRRGAARPPASSSRSPTTCRTTREPTAEELRLIREVLDPEGLRDREVPAGDERATSAADPADRAGRRPAPDRADRHGLGRRAAAGRRPPPTPAGWASSPPPR